MIEKRREEKRREEKRGTTRELTSELYRRYSRINEPKISHLKVFRSDSKALFSDRTDL